MFPFDRLVKAMDEFVSAGTINEDVFAQIGSGEYTPHHVQHVRFLEKSAFDTMLKRADFIVSHAGVGSIVTAQEYGKPLLVVPRLARHGEHVNDHQVATARKYAALGHVLMAENENDIPALLQQLRTFKPVPRVASADSLAARVGRFLHQQIN